MRRVILFCAAAATGVLCGCQAGARPAEFRNTPAEAHVTAQTERRNPMTASGSVEIINPAPRREPMPTIEIVIPANRP